MANAKQTEVKEFLLDVKNAILAGTERDLGWMLRMRQKNDACIAHLGIKRDDVRDELLSLSVLDYCSGPSKDPQIAGDVWVFGKEIAGEEVYIKLKLMGDEKGQTVSVLSFHVPESPLSYPFK